MIILLVIILFSRYLPEDFVGNLKSQRCELRHIQ